MRRFWQKAPIGLDEVRAKYRPRLEGQRATLMHIVTADERPFGFVQSYRIMDSPDYAEEIGVSDGVGMDYFIGEPELIGRGLGRAMLQAYLDEILFPSFPNEQRCIVCYETANAASGGVLRSLGFRREKALIEGGVASTMMILERPS